MEKEVKERMIRVCRGLAEMLELSFQGFRRLTDESIQEAEQAEEEVKRYSTELAGFLISKSSSDKNGREWAKPLLSIASSMDRLAFNIEGIVDRVKMMTYEHIPFSDHAVKEVNDIFQEAMDLVESLPDLLLTQNELLAQSIGEKVRSTFKLVDGFSEEHEERLVRGICTPKSSPIYLGILESLKGVMTNLSDIAAKIISFPSKA